MRPTEHGADHDADAPWFCFARKGVNNVKNIDVKVNVAGLDRLQEALDKAESCIEELYDAVHKLQLAAHNLGVEIEQSQTDCERR